MLDFARIAALALGQSVALLERWLPGGVLRGHEWLCGDLRGSPGESLSVNVHKGYWADFANPSLKGGDLISLYAAIHGVNQGEAARAVQAECGERTEAPVGERRAKPAAPADDWELMRPAPLDAPGWDDVLVNDRWGTAVAHWVYRDAAGHALMIIVRWNLANGDKEIRQFTCRRHRRTGELRWRLGWIDRPRPLYRLDAIAANPGALVLVCEGEKAADAAQRLFPSVVATTSPGGAANGKHADWAALTGRDVIVWPDANETAAQYAATKAKHRGDKPMRPIDHSGSSYAAEIMDVMTRAGVAQVGLIDTGEGAHGRRVIATCCGLDELPRGFDAADVPAGTVLDLMALVTPAANTDQPGDTPRTGVGDERRKGRVPSGEYHQALIDALTEYLTKKDIRPDALDGWRNADWNLVREDVASIALDFAFEFRHHDGIAMSYILETLDAMTRRRRWERRKELLDTVLAHDAAPANAEALQAWVRAVTGTVSPLDLKVMQHWIWNAKRLVLGLRTEHDLMPVIFGKQGSGKTTATEKLAAPFQELAIKIDASYLTDDRRSPVLAAAVVGRWEEMQGSQRADLEALKSTITYPTISYRPMRTTQTVVLPRTCSFLGTSNLPVDAMVQDTTGNRRFYQLTTPVRCDWEVIQALDPAALWRSVDPYGACPLAEVIHMLRDHQAELVHRDPVAMWLSAETWDLLTINRADSTIPWQVLPYNPANGEPFEAIAARFGYWCRTVGQTSIGARALGLRLQQEGFTKRQRRVGNGRAWFYFRPDGATPPPAAAPDPNVPPAPVPVIDFGGDHEPPF